MKRLVSVALLLAISAGSAIAQQKSEGTREFDTTQTYNLVNLAANEAVQKDLGVSAEVGSKLTLLGDEYCAAVQKEYQEAGLTPIYIPNRLTAEQRQKHIELGRSLNDWFFPKVEALLSADQNKRLQQIQFQSRFHNLSSMALLAPEVAADLKLTDDQKQKLNTLESERRQGLSSVFGVKGEEARERLAKQRAEYTTKAIDVLTAEQKETLNKLRGAEFDVSKLVGTVTRRGKGN
jgi:hypothetical protein